MEEAKSAKSKLKQTSGYEDKVKMSRFNLEIGNEFKKFMGVAVAVAGRVTVSVSVCCNVTMLQGTRYKPQYICADNRVHPAQCTLLSFKLNKASF